MFTSTVEVLFLKSNITCTVHVCISAQFSLVKGEGHLSYGCPKNALGERKRPEQKKRKKKQQPNTTYAPLLAIQALILNSVYYLSNYGLCGFSSSYMYIIPIIICSCCLCYIYTYRFPLSECPEVHVCYTVPVFVP